MGQHKDVSIILLLLFTWKAFADFTHLIVLDV